MNIRVPFPVCLWILFWCKPPLLIPIPDWQFNAKKQFFCTYFTSSAQSGDFGQKKSDLICLNHPSSLCELRRGKQCCGVAERGLRIILLYAVYQGCEFLNGRFDIVVIDILPVSGGFISIIRRWCRNYICHPFAEFVGDIHF